MSALGSENEHQTLYTDETRKQGCQVKTIEEVVHPSQ
jgi:hypothetical protein